MDQDVRRLVAFACEGDQLLGSVDEADGAVGVLIVSGGNEIRCGAHRGMALLAAALAADGVPVFRFDRRGIGDSEGENRGYAASGPDIAAAYAAFRREQPQVRRVVGFGNCDAATALLLLDHQCDSLVLANPWLGDEAAAHPPAAVRAHYLRRLRDPSTWRRAFSGDVLGRIKALASIARKPARQPLVAQIGAVLGSRPTTIVIAEGDRTGQVFAATVPLPAGVRSVRIDTASHSFAGSGDLLAEAVRNTLAEPQTGVHV